MNRRRGQSPGGRTEYVKMGYEVRLEAKGEFIYSVSQKTSPMFLAITRESIVGFS